MEYYAAMKNEAEKSLQNDLEWFLRHRVKEKSKVPWNMSSMRQKGIEQNTHVSAHWCKRNIGRINQKVKRLVTYRAWMETGVKGGRKWDGWEGMRKTHHFSQYTFCRTLTLRIMECFKYPSPPPLKSNQNMGLTQKGIQIVTNKPNNISSECYNHTEGDGEGRTLTWLQKTVSWWRW